MVALIFFNELYKFRKKQDKNLFNLLNQFLLVYKVTKRVKMSIRVAIKQISERCIVIIINGIWCDCERLS